MDLFKLVGTIAIDTAKAEKSLNDVSKQVNDTEKVVSEGCDKVKESSEKAGSSVENAGRKVEESGKKGRKAGEDNKKSGEETEKSGNKWVEFGKKVEAVGTKVTGAGKKISSAGGEVVKLGKKFAPVSAAATGALTVVTKGYSGIACYCCSCNTGTYYCGESYYSFWTDTCCSRKAGHRSRKTVGCVCGKSRIAYSCSPSCRGGGFYTFVEYFGVIQKFLD